MDFLTVETFARKYGGNYREYRGGWLLQCPYPDHDDSNPSFSLSMIGLFNCWGCGKTGNFTKLLHDIAGMSWKRSSENVQLLGLRKEWAANSRTRLYHRRDEPTELSKGLLGLFDVNWSEAYELYCHNQKETHRPPWALVFDRGFIPSTLHRFDVGYDPRKQRITIPIFNEREKLVGVLGRTCAKDEEFKYVPYFDFQYTQHVYNLQNAQESAPVILVEGAFDVWWLAQNNCPLHAVATMTSHIKDEQVNMLVERHGRIHVFYDNDPAGRKGAVQAASALTKKGAQVDLIVSPKANIKHLSQKEIFACLQHDRWVYPCDRLAFQEHTISVLNAQS
jgi:DNA primase